MTSATVQATIDAFDTNRQRRNEVRTVSFDEKPKYTEWANLIFDPL